MCSSPLWAWGLRGPLGSGLTAGLRPQQTRWPGCHSALLNCAALHCILIVLQIFMLVTLTQFLEARNCFLWGDPISFDGIIGRHFSNSGETTAVEILKWSTNAMYCLLLNTDLSIASKDNVVLHFSHQIVTTNWHKTCPHLKSTTFEKFEHTWICAALWAAGT